MGKKIFLGRYTVAGDSDLVVFIIGMRVNKLRAVNKWWPVFKAMPLMLRELYSNPELGLMSMESYYGLRSVLMVQYWRSPEQLLSYAKGETHLPAWRDFNKKAKNNDAVGIYHETYIVQNGSYECIYGNMPVFGLAKALEHQPVSAAKNTARKRLMKQTDS